MSEQKGAQMLDLPIEQHTRYAGRISLLGSTGSIGTQCLQVCDNLRLGVEALSANSNVSLLAEQARKYRPRLVVIADKGRYQALKTELEGQSVTILAGADGVCEAAALDGCGTVVNALVGIAGLRPTLAALDAGKTVALANKETLVTGGQLVMDAAKERGAAVIPIDSEHSAMLQCMAGAKREQVRGVILTASGGPFYGKTRAELAAVRPEDALAHPNWQMGSKITIDSATLMNKGFEFIEAMWLFDLRPEQIEVLVHRQSVLHSAVEFQDSSVIAQLGAPDMRVAIQYALTYPDHLPLPGTPLRLRDYGALTFAPPDTETFRGLAVCIEAARHGGLAPCVVNGANERAVELFLAGKISFLDIAALVESAADAVCSAGTPTLAAIEEADALAREQVSRVVQQS